MTYNKTLAGNVCAYC